MAERCARPASSIRRACRAPCCFRAWTAAASGAASRSTRTSGLLYVNANEMAWRVKLAERKMPDGKPTNGKALYQTYCASCHRADLQGQPAGVPVARRHRRAPQRRRSVGDRARGRRPHAGLHASCTAPCAARSSSTWSAARRCGCDAGQAHAVRRPATRSTATSASPIPTGFPAIAPPWGTLTAIDMNKASIAWQVPLGETAGLGPRQSRQRELRRPGRHGQRPALHRRDGLRQQVPGVRRAHGHGAVGDDAAGGRQRDAGRVRGRAGKQYVVIAAGGGKWGAESGGSYVAFALP